MATTVKNFLTKRLENSQVTQYTVASGSTVILDKVTSTNTSAGNVDISVNLVTFGDTPGLGNLVTDTRTLAPNESYTHPELVGQVLEEGDYVSTLTNVSLGITMRISGREIV